MYRYLDESDDPGLADVNRFMIKKNAQVILNCFFSMVKRIGNPLVINELVSF